MSSPAEKYRLLFGEKPDPKATAKLDHLAKVLNISDNDALWSVILVLQQYDTAYKLAPSRIQLTVDTLLEKVQTTVDAQTQTAAERAVNAMAQDVSKIAREVADQTTGRDQAKWMSIMAGVCAIVLLIAGGSGFYFGHKTGAAATTEATLWAITEQGRQARAIAESGIIQLIYNCSGDGWRIGVFEGSRACYPQETNGWLMPW